jgi:hypothetical protein
MRDDLIADLLHFLGRKCGFEAGHAPTSVQRELDALPIPLDLKRLLQWRWPKTVAAIGPYQVVPAEQVLEDERLTRLLEAEMVPVGIARNGDLLVLRFGKEKAAVGLVSHDQLWEGGASPEDAFVPIDSFSASELNALRDEIRSRSET